jgi:hypothetical protein
MTAPELAQETGKSLSSIRSKFIRMNKKGLFAEKFEGFSSENQMPDELVQWAMNSKAKSTGVRKSDESKKSELNEPAKDEFKLSEPVELINEPEPVEPKQEVESVQPEQFDLGKWLFFHPTARFSYVLALIAVQAWIFASLAERVFMAQGNHLPKIAMLLVGVLVESVGIMISKNFKPTRFQGSIARNRWLFVFLVWQCLVDLSYFNLLGSNSNLIGQYVIAASVPMGILAYSSLYFKDTES